MYVLILIKNNWLGYNLGAFFTSLSGHPGGKRDRILRIFRVTRMMVNGHPLSMSYPYLYIIFGNSVVEPDSY
jgi:hypothetical protein